MAPPPKPLPPSRPQSERPDSPPDPPRLGALLRDARKARGLTLAALGDLVEAAPSYLSMIENHRVENPPSASLLERLEAALHLPDAPLRRAAAWQTTPQAVRAEVVRLAEEAERGRKLAAWLRAQTAPRSDTAGQSGTAGRPKPVGSIGKDLDALYRSGQLSKRINAVLRGGNADPKTPNARKASDADPPHPPEAPPPPESRQAPKASPGGLAPPMWLRNAPRIPLINRVAAGDPSSFTDLGFPAGVADDYLSVPGLTDPDAFATRIDGQSMHPDYQEGDIVVFSPIADVTDGCDAFVRLEPEHDVTFKRVYFDEEAGTVRLQPLNPRFAPRIVAREQVAGCFRAVWRFAKL